MKKGFTLLELIVVVIILGVLGTLGMTQYTRTVEKSRSVEVKKVLGQVREIAAAYYQAQGTLTGLTLDMVSVGPGIDQYPDNCNNNSHYFFVSDWWVANPELYIEFTRCPGGAGRGKGSPTRYAGQWIGMKITWPGEIESLDSSSVYK